MISRKRIKETIAADFRDPCSGDPGSCENPGFSVTLSVFVFSTAAFVVSALILKALMTVIIALLLLAFSLPFDFNLFRVSFYAFNASQWTTESILVIFGSGGIALFILGILLLRLHNRSWKARMLLAWMSFLMINWLPLSMVSSMFVFKEFAVAFQWIIPDFFIRLSVSLFALAVSVSYRPFWTIRFLLTSNSIRFLESTDKRKSYLRISFIYPWLLGSLIMLPFLLIPPDTVWILLVFGSGLVVLPLYRKREMPLLSLKIYKSATKSIRPAGFITAVILLLALIWTVSHFSIRF